MKSRHWTISESVVVKAGVTGPDTGREEGHNEFAALRSWHAYLEEHLVFPFATAVEEYQRGQVRQGARVTVLAVIFLDETYGTIVAVKHTHGVNELPLCDLKACAGYLAHPFRKIGF